MSLLVGLGILDGCSVFVTVVRLHGKSEAKDARKKEEERKTKEVGQCDWPALYSIRVT